MQKPISIAMNHLQFMSLDFILLFLDHIEEWRDNQGKRRTEFVTHIGKEVEFQLIEFSILSDILLHFFFFKNYFLLFDSSLTIEIEE